MTLRNTWFYLPVLFAFGKYLLFRKKKNLLIQKNKKIRVHSLRVFTYVAVVFSEFTLF